MHPLSVLIHLVCFVTVPNGFISSPHLIFYCLSVHSYLVCLIAVLNVMCVQIDNLPLINCGILFMFYLLAELLIRILVSHVNLVFFMVVMNQFFIWQPHFFVTIATTFFCY